MHRSQFDQNLELREERRGDVLIIYLEEERLTGGNAPIFQAHLVHRIMAGNEHLVLDLSQVEAIDQSGIEAIKMGLQAVGTDGDLVLCGISESVMETLRDTLMNQVFGIFREPNDALAALT